MQTFVYMVFILPEQHCREPAATPTTALNSTPLFTAYHCISCLRTPSNSHYLPYTSLSSQQDVRYSLELPVTPGVSQAKDILKAISITCHHDFGNAIILCPTAIRFYQTSIIYNYASIRTKYLVEKKCGFPVSLQLITSPVSVSMLS